MQDLSLANYKRLLRKRIAQQRRQLTLKERSHLSALAAEHILKTPLWESARTIALYVPVRGEMDTATLLESAWGKGKSILLPVCSKENRGEMCLLPCSGYNDLQPGLYGIPEPLPPKNHLQKSFLAPETAIDLMIIPGLAFDLSGTRLGMGGGFYDRLLARLEQKHCVRLGLAYSFQIVKLLPREPWDMPIHALGTEKSLLRLS